MELSETIQAYVKWAAIVLLAVLALAYGYDYLSVQHRMGAHNPNDPLDSITYPRLLAIPQKGNRVEYALDATSPTQTVACVHSLFPHFGYVPCWYIRRYAENPIPMTIIVPAQALRKN